MECEWMYPPCRDDIDDIYDDMREYRLQHNKCIKRIRKELKCLATLEERRIHIEAELIFYNKPKSSDKPRECAPCRTDINDIYDDMMAYRVIHDKCIKRVKKELKFLEMFEAKRIETETELIVYNRLHSGMKNND